MLKLNNIKTGYGDLKVLFDVSMEIKDGEFVTLVGSNGAGKTTLLRAISGLLPLNGGTIGWDNCDITRMPAHDRPALGIAHIPQGRGILATLSVRDNLMLGGYIPKLRKKRDENIARVLDMFPVLKDRMEHDAGSLSGGQQQMLAIGRALMLEPKLLILDEPSLGLAPVIVEEIYKIISSLKSQNTSMLLIEQNLQRALAIADRGYVMETGRIVIEGTSKELKENQQVKKAYLGL